MLQPRSQKFSTRSFGVKNIIALFPIYGGHFIESKVVADAKTDFPCSDVKSCQSVSWGQSLGLFEGDFSGNVNIKKMSLEMWIKIKMFINRGMIFILSGAWQLNFPQETRQWMCCRALLCHLQLLSRG
jgi:hypothetical protein